MYIIDRIEENYERAMINTPAERLSEYILMNLESVPEMTRMYPRDLSINIYPCLRVWDPTLLFRVL